jgi:hypothetical protein
MDVCLCVSMLYCPVPLRRADHSFKGVLPSVKIDYETSGVRRPKSLRTLEPLMTMMMMMVDCKLIPPLEVGHCTNSWRTFSLPHRIYKQ